MIETWMSVKVCFRISVFIFFLFSFLFSFSQTTCFNMAVQSYTSDGCTQNCNLSEFSGLSNPCTNSIGSTGGPSKSFSLTFVVNAGCSATLSAYFGRRCNGTFCSSCSNNCSPSSNNGCCNSGMDSGDQVSVGGAGGSGTTLSSTLFTSASGGVYNSTCGSSGASSSTVISGNTITATGSNNGGALVRIVQTGGTLYVAGTSNRADEIITFTLTIQAGCTCPTLNEDISFFYGNQTKGKILLNWATLNEENISYFRIDKYNHTNNDFQLLQIVEKRGFPSAYLIEDLEPQPGQNVYRLSTMKKSGWTDKVFFWETYLKDDLNDEKIFSFFYYQNGELTWKFPESMQVRGFTLRDITGRSVFRYSEGNNILSSTNLEPGIYFIELQTLSEVKRIRVLLNP